MVKKILVEFTGFINLKGRNNAINSNNFNEILSSPGMCDQFIRMKTYYQ